MNGSAARFFRLSVSLTGLVTLGWVLTGQAARPAHRGTPLPTDWSHRHLIFSHPATSEQAARVSEDPRYWQQLQRLSHRLALPAHEPEPEASFLPVNASKKRPLTSKLFRRDWSEDLGHVVAAGTGAGNFPAKFVFESNVANCGSATTPDYVVYSTGLAGSGTQADIVAYDNIYSGCTGTVPSVYWAYNTSTSSLVLTSPVLSRDGTQIAFVQTDTVRAQVVLLRWKAGTGSVGTPAPPTSVAPASYPGCTAPCMTTFQLVDPTGPIDSDDTTSSVFYDYSGDVAWVGDSHGVLHKFSPFFKGTTLNPPAESGAPWPVVVDPAIQLTSPVYDHVSATVFVAGLDSGRLYRVDPALGTVTPSGILDRSSVLVAAPTVDSSNGRVYVFAAEDPSAACAGADCTGVYQFPTNFAAASTGTEAVVGTSVTFPAIPNPLYAGDFDSNYFTSNNGTGNLYVCGNSGLNPILYQVPIAAGVMGAPAVVSTLATAGKTPACSPVTDISAPPATAGNAATESLFVSVQNNSRACAGSGCIQNLVDTPWQASTTFAIGQEILVKSASPATRFTFVATTAGTTSATQPSWPSTPGVTPPADGGVTWINQGNPNVIPNDWAPSTPYAAGIRVIDGIGQVEISTGAGTSGATAPIWSTTPNTTTNDNGIPWNNLGVFPIAALGATGGTSGIIIDNTVTTGTPTGTSQVYFTTLDNQPCGTSGTGGCAVQASQSALK